MEPRELAVSNGITARMDKERRLVALPLRLRPRRTLAFPAECPGEGPSMWFSLDVRQPGPARRCAAGFSSAHGRTTDDSLKQWKETCVESSVLTLHVFETLKK